jgi:hypothetical protein
MILDGIVDEKFHKSGGHHPVVIAQTESLFLLSHFIPWVPA